MRTFKSRILRSIEDIAEAAKLELVVVCTATSKRDATIIHVMVPDTWRTVARVRLVLDVGGFELHYSHLDVNGVFPVGGSGFARPTIRYHDGDGIVAALEAVRKGIGP